MIEDDFEPYLLSQRTQSTFAEMFRDKPKTGNKSMPNARMPDNPIYNTVSYQDIVDAFEEARRSR